MSLDTTASPTPSSPCILIYAARERARTFARTAFPRRKAKTVVVKSVEEFDHAIRRELIDAAIVDLGAPTDDSWVIAGRAQDFPSTAFFGLVPARAGDTPTIAKCAQLEFADVLAEHIDEEVARELVGPYTYTTRFARALHEPPPSIGLVTETQRKTWEAIIQHGGRPVTTRELASTIGVTREHLSRNFAQGRGANLKRVIDLVRLISAAELSKNPGYDVRDVAAVLGFASSSHLAVTTQRIASTRPASLSGLRTVDLIERFTQGRTRSRATIASQE
ncbi:MAG TPA: AraC family transcriptional regulator [Gemmatimonadaceae bacterium]|jgi:AraC-like DNA-binding protein|nr:AraC family transcriptional regulator [Gemmatimonadaceae bacterium]